MFEHYWYKSTYLSEFCLYAYFVTILVIKCKKSNRQVFEFEKLYPHKSNLIQRHYIKSNSKFFVILIGTLFQYQSEENIIPSNHLDIIFQQDNLFEILLALFIL